MSFVLQRLVRDEESFCKCYTPQKHGLETIHVLKIILVLSMCFFAGFGYSEPLEDTQIYFSVSAGDAVNTLSLASEQAGIDLVFRLDIVEGKRTQALSGSYTVEEAFEYLLLGSNLMLINDMKSQTYAIISVQGDSDMEPQNLEVVNPKNESTMKMNEKQNIAQRLFSALTGLLIASSANLNAQDINDDDVFELSPFVIESSDNEGYLATSTLAGSRLRTNLSDVGASISVITNQFLEDTNSTDLRDALVYSAGTEVSGLGGNFSNASGTGTELTTDTSLGNNVGTRVRGLAAATLTRNYFRSSIPFDTYNSDRIEINRGANAILFGVGSPAGIINYSTHTASTSKSFGEIDMRLGRFGSNRLSFDFNKPIIENELAIRVSVLRDDEKFQQDPAFNNDHRVFFTGVYTPDFLVTENGIFSGTTFRFSYENGEIEANNPRSLPPQDNIVRWFEPTAEMLEVGVIPKFTRDNTQNLSFNNGIFATQGLRRTPVILFRDPNSPVPTDHIQQNAIARQYTINRSSVRNGTTAMFSPGNLADSLRREGFPNSNFYKTPSLIDRSVFDYRNNLIDGDNKREILDIESANFSVEQLFFNNQAGIEFVYDEQETVDERYAVFSSRPIIELDVNTVLVEGEPNPDFGRPFISSRGNANASWGYREAETMRITAFGELDFEKLMDQGWGKWLGKHTFTLLYQDEETFAENRSGKIWYIPDTPWLYGNNQSRFSNAGKSVEVLQFLGPSLADASSASGANLGRVSNNLVDLPSITEGGSLYLREMAAGSDFDFVPANIVRAQSDLSDNARNASKSLRQIESQALNIQSRLLDGHIITNFGWRDEEVSIFDVNAPLVSDGQGFRLVNDPAYAFGSEADLAASQTLFSWNVVGKVPYGFLQKLPLITGLNLHYNESENFSPPQGLRISPLGDVLSPPTGETKDYGFWVEFQEGKYQAKINWYETKQSLVTNGTITGAVNSVVGNHILAYNAVQDGIAQDDDGDGFPNFYVAPPQFLLDLYNVRIDNGSISSTNPGIAATGEFVAEGMEIELTANPTDNWTIIFNATRQESIRDNTGVAAEQLLFNTPVEDGRSIIENWLELWTVPLFEAGTFNPGPDTTGTLRNFTLREIVNPYNGVKLQDGAPAQELREWRYNLVTNYAFDEGVLDGVNIGGAYRWQDKVAIGFPLTADEQEQVIIDVNNPHFGPTTSNVDFWIGYRRTLFDGKINWKLQLNVRNALSDDDLIPIFTQPTGEEVVFRISESRLWTIRSTFSF